MSAVTLLAESLARTDDNAQIMPKMPTVRHSGCAYSLMYPPIRSKMKAVQSTPSSGPTTELVR